MFYACRNFRYQHAADLRTDLHRLKREFGSNRPSARTDLSLPLPGSPPLVTVAAENAAAAALVSNSASSSSTVISIVREHKFGFVVISFVVLLLAATALYGLYSFLSRSRIPPFANFTVDKVTDTGKVGPTAISPDAKFILSVQRNNGEQSLWLRNVATGSDTQVVAPERSDLQRSRILS